jgi:nucleoside 2-deoxyribosyltransferase
MKIYLACTVRGDRAAVIALRRACERLQARGHEVLTAHLLRDDVEAVESALSERDVYERDIAWLESCDALVAEASGSSFGVGFEVGYILARAPQTGQRVYLLYRADRGAQISRLISGNSDPHCAKYAYTSADDLLTFIDTHFD